MNDKTVLPPVAFDRSSSVGRAIYRGAGGRGFDSWGRTYTQGLKITKEEGISFGVQTARYNFAWLRLPRTVKQAFLSPVADRNTVTC